MQIAAHKMQVYSEEELKCQVYNEMLHYGKWQHLRL